MENSRFFNASTANSRVLKFLTESVKMSLYRRAYICHLFSEIFKLDRICRRRFSPQVKRELDRISPQVKRELSVLKSCLKGCVHSKTCRANVTIFREAKKCIGLCRLYYLQEHWEPSENEPWFVENVWCGKKRPNKKFRLLYEWVEDEIDARKSILVSEVREHAGLLLGEESGKYKNLRSSVSG